MPKAFTVFVQNHFFRNNFIKSEPIGTKFYRETYGQEARSRADFGALRQTGGKWRQKAAFCELFSAKQRF